LLFICYPGRKAHSWHTLFEGSQYAEVSENQLLVLALNDLEVGADKTENKKAPLPG